jgi:hypothetical protein
MRATPLLILLRVPLALFADTIHEGKVAKIAGGGIDMNRELLAREYAWMYR